jgi:hypothetical protein
LRPDIDPNVEIRKSGTDRKSGCDQINLQLWNGGKTTRDGKTFGSGLVPEFLIKVCVLKSIRMWKSGNQERTGEQNVIWNSGMAGRRSGNGNAFWSRLVPEFLSSTSRFDDLRRTGVREGRPNMGRSTREVEDRYTCDDEEHAHGYDHPQIHFGGATRQIYLRHAIAIFIDRHGRTDPPRE